MRRVVVDATSMPVNIVSVTMAMYVMQVTIVMMRVTMALAVIGVVVA